MNVTTWMQSGESYGQNTVTGSSTAQDSGTFTFTCPDGDYYLYVGIGSNTFDKIYDEQVRFIDYLGTIIPMSEVTTGTVNAYKSTNKITINSDTTLWLKFLEL